MQSIIFTVGALLREEDYEYIKKGDVTRIKRKFFLNSIWSCDYVCHNGVDKDMVKEVNGYYSNIELMQDKY